jgi:hypothetical protein
MIQKVRPAIAFSLPFLTGCVSVNQVPEANFELKLVPRVVALEIVRKYVSSADLNGIRLGGIGATSGCKSRTATVRYGEINRFFYQKLSSTTMSTVYANFDYWSLCGMGLVTYRISREEALEFAGALNSLGAKIDRVTTAE